MAEPALGDAVAEPIQADWDGTPPPLSADHLARYLTHLGVRRPDAPTLTALAEIQLAHLRSIPFENLDPMRGVPVSLQPDALAAKMLSGTRGGYCFEHNILLGSALVALGYPVRLMAGRGLVGMQALRPRTHLALLVTPDDGEERLVDAGFGRTSLVAPLQLSFGTVATVGGDRYRLRRSGDEWLVESARADGPWLQLYILDPRPVYPIDVEMANHFVSSHPESHMRQRVILLRPTARGKRSLSGRTLVIDEGERQVARDITLPEFGAVLRDEFGIVLDEPLAQLPS